MRKERERKRAENKGGNEPTNALRDQQTQRTKTRKKTQSLRFLRARNEADGERYLFCNHLSLSFKSTIPFIQYTQTLLATRKRTHARKNARTHSRTTCSQDATCMRVVCVRCSVCVPTNIPSPPFPSFFSLTFSFKLRIETQILSLMH